jgi:competence protein ComEC
MKKIYWLIVVFNLVAIATLFWQWPEQQGSLVFCDVGQGDATLVTRGSFQVLIDTGPNEKVIKCLNQHMAWWDTQVEVVIITHFDKDHVGGLEEILENYELKLLYADFNSLNFDELENLLKTIKKKISDGLVVKQPILGEKIRFLPGIELKTLSNSDFEKDIKNINDTFLYETELSDLSLENEQKNIDKNSRSIVQLLTIDQVTVLLTGDTESLQEAALNSAGLISRTDILKVGHHGSKLSTSEEFLLKVHPEISVISCSNSNSYGHPSRETLERLSQVGGQILRTDQMGSIEFGIKGFRYWLKKPPNYN